MLDGGRKRSERPYRNTGVQVKMTLGVGGRCKFSPLVNTLIIQFFRGKDVDKSLFQSVNSASLKPLSALPII
jgi:hypothetical protein